MKGENISTNWADILAVTSSYENVDELRDRFKEIRHHLDDGDKKEDAGSGKKEKKQKGKDKNKDEIATQKKEEGLKKAAEKKAAKEAEKAKEEGATTKVIKPEPALNAPSLLTIIQDEMATTSTTASKPYDKNKGIAAAAKHFDKTGVRVTPREALKLAEGK